MQFAQGHGKGSRVHHVIGSAILHIHQRPFSFNVSSVIGSTPSPIHIGASSSNGVPHLWVLRWSAAPLLPPSLRLRWHSLTAVLFKCLTCEFFGDQRTSPTVASPAMNCTSSDTAVSLSKLNIEAMALSSALHKGTYNYGANCESDKPLFWRFIKLLCLSRLEYFHDRLTSTR